MVNGAGANVTVSELGGQTQHDFNGCHHGKLKLDLWTQVTVNHRVHACVFSYLCVCVLVFPENELSVLVTSFLGPAVLEGEPIKQT